MAVTLTERPPASSADDHELVAALRGGDERAFAELYQRYYDRIVVYVRGMVRDHARAEDVTHDVFLSALRRMRETEGPIAFKPWIYEIARNACIDQFRRARRAEEVSLEGGSGLRPADVGRLTSTERTPDAAVDQRQQITDLRGAFGGLSESHHEILVLRELEGLSYAEIGDRMGLTRPSVESLLFRARRRLGEEYEELASGRRCVRTREIISRAGEDRLGAGDRRRLARHLSACPHCRHQARLAELDESALARRRSIGQRIAALLPIPTWLRRGGSDRATAVGDHASTALPNWATLLPALEPVAGGAGRALVAAATVAVASLGAGAATKALTTDPAVRPQVAPRVHHVSVAPDRRPSGTARAPASALAGRTRAVRVPARGPRSHARTVVGGGQHVSAPARGNGAGSPPRAPRISTGDGTALPRQAPSSSVKHDAVVGPPLSPGHGLAGSGVPAPGMSHAGSPLSFVPVVPPAPPLPGPGIPTGPATRAVSVIAPAAPATRAVTVIAPTAPLPPLPGGAGRTAEQLRRVAGGVGVGS